MWCSEDMMLEYEMKEREREREMYCVYDDETYSYYNNNLYPHERVGHNVPNGEESSWRGEFAVNCRR